MAGQRADARRNYALLLAVAERAIAEQGADASLEQIARTAGVGSGTVRRHFPTRHALLEAVFTRQVDALTEKARDIGPDSRAALLDWLDELLRFAATTRGLAEALNRDHAADPTEPHDHCATARLTEAGTPLVTRAAADGTLAPGVTITDLLNLVTGIALATEHHPDGPAEAKRLLRLTIEGVSPRSPAA